MISCRNLSFYYGKKQILNNINIELAKEGVYALVGENGVGKTTFLKLLLNILQSDGIDNDYLKSCSFVLNDDALYDNLTVYENLYYFALLKKINVKNIEAILSKCHILDYKSVKIKKLSKGTKQKVLIAKCLLQDCYLYIFDEPYNGLDPKECDNFNTLIKELKKQGKLVIISSHILSGLSDIYDYIILIENKDVYMYDKNKISSLASLFRKNL